mmetsp:Transcript_39492/g.73632  ORF Transcript_39492/g.73632 Transcript_39492/m.73632 type:complete len:268 (+) Transcript_39492:597-1400(+)
MAVGLLLLCPGTSFIRVTRLCLHRVHVVLQLLHQLGLTSHAIVELLGFGLLLLIQDFVVLLYGGCLLLLGFLGSLISLDLVLLVLFKNLAHGFLCLFFLLLKALLVRLHLVDNLFHQLSFLILLALLLSVLQQAFVAKLLITILFLFHDPLLPLLFPLLLLLLPAFQFHHGVLMVLLFLLQCLIPSLQLVLHLRIQVQLHLPLKCLHPELLTKRVLLMQVRGILVKLGPVMLPLWGHEMLPGQGGSAAASLAQASVLRHTADGLAHG